MTEGEKRAYGRGYNTGSRHGWPSHKPPTPPDPLVAALIEALKSLRDAADWYCATVGCGSDSEAIDDPFAAELIPKIDAANEALRAIVLWLTESE